MTVFEHPLNERIRSFLRLQQLFVRLDHHLNGMSRCDLQASIGVLLEAYDLTSRSNLKTEAIKELERQESSILKPTSGGKITDPQAQLLSETIRSLRTQLYEQPIRSHQHLQSNEFLNSVKQRCGASVSGSTNDLPLYHFWLDLDPVECRNTIIEWMQPYRYLRQAIDLLLSNIRDSQKLEDTVAERGFYQDSLSREKTLQLVRVEIPKMPDIYPEISAGIHRITIRFMRYKSASERPSQELSNIDFCIAYCTF